MKKVIYLLALLTVAVLTPKFLFSAENSNQVKLKFTRGSCEFNMNGFSAFDTKERDGIIKTSWLNDNTLLVECFTTGNCAAKVTGSFELKDNSLFLKYKTILGSQVAECLCFHKFNYELSGIPKKDYKIILKANDNFD